MKQKEFVLDTDDGHRIYGLLNAAETGKADRLVILAHGLTGHPHEYIHEMAWRYFTRKGYDVARFAFYGQQKEARQLPDCTLAIHASDLNRVIEHFSRSYEKIFVCGHSYGGLTMLFSRPQVTAVSFWDSSFKPYGSFWKDEAKFVPELGCYAVHWGCVSLIGKGMYEEARNLTDAQADAMAAAFGVPAQVVFAGANEAELDRYGLYEALSEPKEKQTISGADHCFYSGETVFDLLDKTNAWFGRF